MKSFLISILLTILLYNSTTDSQWILSINDAGISLVSSGNDIFYGTWFAGVYKSTNLGQSWAGTYFPPGNSVRALITNMYGIFAGTTYNGVYVTTNEGLNWASMSNGLTLDQINTFTKIGNIIFVGGYSGVFSSTNNGLSWNSANNGLTNMYVYCLIAAGNNIFAGTLNGGIFLTTNNGLSWNPLNNGLTNLNISALAFNGNYVFAGTFGNGVFQSGANGSTWTPVNIGLNNLYIGSLTSSGNSIVVGTDTGGVYYSSNNGQSWMQKNEGLISPLYFKSLLISNNYIFAGIDNNIWKRPFYEITGIQPPKNTIPDKFSLSQNFPNPFNPSTMISYDIPIDGFVKITVYDFLGREVKTLVNEKQNPGSYQVQFDGSNLASGVYFYKLQAGDFIQTKRMTMLK